MESNAIKFSDGQLVECVEVSLAREKGLFVNNRQGLLIHPIVLTVKQEEQQAGTQMHWLQRSIRYKTTLALN